MKMQKKIAAKCSKKATKIYQSEINSVLKNDIMFYVVQLLNHLADFLP